MLTKNITRSCFVLNIVIKEGNIFFLFDTSLVLCLLFKTHMVKTHTHGPALWTVPGSPHFYKVHGCGSFPSKIDGNLHSQLPERLARSRPVRGGIVFTKIPPSQQLCQERQRISFLGTVFYSAQMRVAVTQECALAIQRLAASFVAGASRPLKSFQRMLDLMVSASPVLQLNLLRMRPLQRWLKPRVPSSRTPANQGEQVISLSALPPSDEDQELKLLYPIRAVKIYLECSTLFRQLDQLFVCFGNCTKGRPVTK